MKREVLSILDRCNLDVLARELSAYPSQRLVNPLFSALCNPSEMVRWHAVYSFGLVVPALYGKDSDSARTVMRRCLWALNDESGGIGWGVPEAMAQIMCNCAPLRKEYLHMLVSYMRRDGEEAYQDGNYLELPMLQRGLLWGIGRLCQVHRHEMLALQVDDHIVAYLNSHDIYVNALALWSLGLLGADHYREKIIQFLNCQNEVRLFIDGKMQTFTVGGLADRALGEDRTH